MRVVAVTLLHGDEPFLIDEAIGRTTRALISDAATTSRQQSVATTMYGQRLVIDGSSLLKTASVEAERLALRCLPQLLRPLGKVCVNHPADYNRRHDGGASERQR